jgi:LemA protein
VNPYTIFMIALPSFVVFVIIARVFNHLVLVKHNVQRAWADTCVLLRQRQEELAKLVVVCRQHASFEGGMLEGVTRARKLVDKELLHGDPVGLGEAERELRKDLVRFLAVAEAHPTLGADKSFSHLSRRISELETSIADRRAFYNAQVEINNSTIQSFPELLLAVPFGFKDAQFLVFDTKQTEDVGVARSFATKRT